MSPLLQPGSSPAVGFESPFEMLDACHERVRRSLDLLARLITHLERQGIDAAARDAAHDVWRYFTIAAPQHHQDEERHVFAWAARSGRADLAAAAGRLQIEHRDFDRQWHTLGPLLLALHGRPIPGGAVTSPAGAHGAQTVHGDPDGAHDAIPPPDLAALCAAARHFIDSHQDHLALEDGLLLPAAAQAFRQQPAAALQAMGDEMAARRGAPRPAGPAGPAAPGDPARAADG
ncbi:MAG: hypothetical protein RL223_1605 [Pseudomonadota bacterium]|jgi:hemerythrin-like domain-containing protein